MISEIFKRSTTFAVNNSPAILTAVGVAGVVATAVLTGQATVKAVHLIEAEENTLMRPLDIKEKAKLTWMLYIPPATVIALTCGAIVGANQIGTRRTAAMAAAYTLSERAMSEYKEQVVKKIGEKKEKEVSDAVVAERVSKTNVPSNLVIVSGKNALCYDFWSGRYFTSSMEDLKHAQNALNHTILSKSFDNTASLTDFYNLIGLEPIQGSDDLGWNVNHMLEIEFTSCLSPDQEPAIAIRFRVEPKRDYFRG